MKKSESIELLAKALAQAQLQIEGAIKDSNNPFFNSKYADLAAVWGVCREPLSKNGLAVIQMPCQIGEKAALETVLTHESGQWISEVIELNPVKKDPQGMGSAITYFRRYSLAAMVGVFQEDDDANTHNDRKPPITSAKQNTIVTPKVEKQTKPQPIVKEKTGITDEQRQSIVERLTKLQFNADDIKNFIVKASGGKQAKDWLPKDYENVLLSIEALEINNPQTQDTFEEYA